MSRLPSTASASDAPSASSPARSQSSRRRSGSTGGLLLGLAFVVSLATLAPQSAGAQSILDRVRERASSRAQSETERKANERVDSAVDQTVDCMFDPVTCAQNAKPAETPGSTETAAPAEADDAEWYAEQSGSRVGPMPRSQLDSMVTAGQITAQTLVWREGLEDWTAAGRIPELAERFKKVPPPLPKSSGPPPLPSGAGPSAR
jgi:hypothetical protein